MNNASETIKGMVFDIQRYSLHDGPGIRTIIFLKGCPLRCKWCSNPESQHTGPQLFFTKSRCIRCGHCVESCTNNEVTMTKDGIKVNWDAVDNENLEWARVCPTEALSVKGEWMTVEEAFNEVIKDEVFYRQSGGGVTLSGGEPLLQSQFALELLKRVHEEGISTAVETTGAVSKEVLFAVMPYVDLFLYDFKHCDDEAHVKYIGASNNLIKSNLKALSEAGADIMVRTPLIPGVNDSKECIKEIMRILKAYGIKKYALLPFHQYGSGKYESIGMSYELKELSAHDSKYVEGLREMIEKDGFISSFQ